MRLRSSLAKRCKAQRIRGSAAQPETLAASPLPRRGASMAFRSNAVFGPICKMLYEIQLIKFYTYAIRSNARLKLIASNDPLTYSGQYAFPTMQLWTTTMIEILLTVGAWQLFCLGWAARTTNSSPIF
jgi:hypothetical protein